MTRLLLAALAALAVVSAHAGGILGAFAGGGGPVFFVYTTTVADSEAILNAQAGIQYGSNGVISSVTTPGTVTTGTNWISPTNYAPGAYTVRAHQNSGTAVAGPALDTDLALSSNRSWSITESVSGTLNANITITIKDGLGNTVKTGSIAFQATKS